MQALRLRVPIKELFEKVVKSAGQGVQVSLLHADA
jgi:hypothetical protein